MATFTTSDGLALYYHDEGTGLPVLCLAGLTRNSSDFEFVMPHMGHVRMIRMDYRGRGLSDHDTDFMNYSILREAQDAIELLDHLGIGKTAVIGTSRGGLISMLLGQTHPERLLGVMLNDIGPEIAPSGLSRIMDYLGLCPGFQSYDAAADGLLAAYSGSFPDVSRARWKRQAELMWTQNPEGGLGLRYDPRLRDAMIAQASAGPPPDLWPLFGQLAARPLAALRGNNSDLLSPEIFTKMQERCPDMIATTVQNRGHVPFLDEAESLTTLHLFLESLT